MKLKTFADEIKDDFMKSSEMYCCYCVKPKGDKFSCCLENHFVEFSDLDEESQQLLIDDEIYKYEAWSKQ